LDAFDRTHHLPAAANAKELIEAHFAEPLDVKRLARMMGCHPVRLRSTFKKELGMSMREYQTRLRIHHAAKLLVESDLKIDAIMLTVGYRSRKNFYQAFRRLVRATPSALRRHRPTGRYSKVHLN